MTFINSVISILRTPAKTILFVILVAAVTAFSCLGFGMWNSADRLIAEAEATYTTVANIEYVDEGYPDALVYSQTMYNQLSSYDPTPLSENDNVIEFDRQYEIGGYIDGFELKSSDNPFDGYGVLKFKFMYITDMGYMCINLGEPYYVGSLRYMDGTMFYVRFGNMFPSSTIDMLEPNHYYLGYGLLYEGEDRKNVFEIIPYEYAYAGADSDTYLLNEPLFELPCWDITDYLDDFESKPEFETFHKIATSYHVMNNYISVYPTSNAAVTSPFLQSQTYIVEDQNGVQGRFFTEQEYAAGSRVVLLSEFIANKMDLGVGDTISLSLYSANGSVSSRCSFWADDEFIEQGEYEIVGLFKSGPGLNTVAYIPKPVGEDTWLPDSSVSYQIATVTLKNGSVDRYIEEIAPYLGENMRITAYDQGYSAAIAPIQSMRETAILLATISVVCCLVVLVLFAFMYVSKQRDTVSIMYALGSGKARGALYLLLCILLIAATAAIIGVTGGYLLSENITRTAYEAAEDISTVDHTFSARYLVKEDQDIRLTPDFKPDVGVLVCVGTAVVGASLLFAAVLSAVTLHSIHPKRLFSRGKEKKHES